MPKIRVHYGPAMEIVVSLVILATEKEMDSIILLYMHANVANPAIDEKLEECKQLAKAMNDTHGVTNL